MNQPLGAVGPLVSVVVTVYNKAPFVLETLRSIERQTYAPLDVVIVDDGSTDGSGDIVQAWSLPSTARIICLTNGGVSRARNVGYSHCRPESEYVLFLDADDVLEANALERLVRHLREEPTAAACYSSPRLIDVDGQLLGDDPDDARWIPAGLGRRALRDDQLDTPLASICARFRIMPSTALIRRSSYDVTAGWDEDLCRPRRPFQAEDKDMLIQLALVGGVHRLPVRLVRYRVLPSAHNDALYEGLRAVNVKWWNAPLPRGAHRRVRRAIRFDARVAVLDAAAQLARGVRMRHTGTIRSGLNALVRATARWAVLPMRCRARPTTLGRPSSRAGARRHRWPSAAGA